MCVCGSIRADKLTSMYTWDETQWLYSAIMNMTMLKLKETDRLNKIQLVLMS